MADDGVSLNMVKSDESVDFNLDGEEGEGRDEACVNIEK